MVETITIPRDAYEFDCTRYPEMERLAIEFSREIAGPKGGRPSLPDPIRILEMAHAMLKAAVEPPPATIDGEVVEDGNAV
ncbi:hypothetical protein [Oricola thermophila]|uniref:Uncharacterized protein n=1 Tax=Oricola thermophila TaxID=2742145 RepID=A0A6N1VDG2_9HYPH|nr:hypothetical protein [Oricola thermophila]QKV18758.1 hypothetical protein HTY61_09995 [Oricola thermophila]